MANIIDGLILTILGVIITSIGIYSYKNRKISYYIIFPGSPKTKSSTVSIIGIIIVFLGAIGLILN